jgi:hypothetical protein
MIKHVIKHMIEHMIKHTIGHVIDEAERCRRMLGLMRH